MSRSEQELIRLEKLSKLRAKGFAYPNDVKCTADARDLASVEIVPPEQAPRWTMAGRIVQLRVMGKASFVHLLDSHAKFQVYVRQQEVGDEVYEAFRSYDIGDVVEVKGYPFLTKTGERTLHVEAIRILSKALRPLPEKWHGLTDQETRYRHRYLDLISNPAARQLFRARTRIIKEIRHFLDQRDFLEVETPVLEYTQGGTTAKPFRTHFNALHCDMVLRIALELPLKKLVVGGLDRVYALGTVFRNEGLSKKHNPEFTMLEFYQAYANFDDMMNFTQDLLVHLVQTIHGKLTCTYGEHQLDFTPPYPRIAMQESLYAIGGVPRTERVSELPTLLRIAERHKMDLRDMSDWGHTLEDVFGELVEPKLINPTFITHHPFSTSPLARKNSEDPTVVDRFELFVAGMETANAFSELNDPIDQRERFEAQAARKAAGDEEACEVDEDFVKALEYGLPPTGGEGIGIDRLVMLLTNSPNIREVILFPHLRPEEGRESILEGADESAQAGEKA
ncbi:MAG: lysine--tRNA ligase [Bdellovibrionota bacterium]|nr:MAG: lysine--tRNA ligase [Bdellovibrionota bacterium]